MKNIIYTITLEILPLCSSCSDFLDRQVPQGTISNDQLRNPKYIDDLVVSAYAVWITAEDINSSFLIRNYDVCSDDAYKDKVIVIPTDAPNAIYAGLAASIDLLNPEEKEEASCMVNNIANSQYISFKDVQADRVDLNEFKLMWWQFHVVGGIDTISKFEKAAPSAINAMSKIKKLYNKGLNLLLICYTTF